MTEIESSKAFAIRYAAELKERYANLLTVEDVIEQAQKDGMFESDDEMVSVWGRLNRILPNRGGTNSPVMAKCDICNKTSNLLTGKDKFNLRGTWAGVDFYNEICTDCWAIQKDLR